MTTAGELLARKGAGVQTVSPDASVLEAARSMNERRIGAVCVVEGKQLVGMFTERDVLCRVVAEQRNPADAKVREVMTKEVLTVEPSAHVADCSRMMIERKIRHLPIVDKGELVGLISTGDLMALDVAMKQAHIEHLHRYLHGRV